MYKQSLLPRNPSFKVLLRVAASNFGSVLHDISESLCPPTRSPQAHSCEHKKPIQLFQPSVFQWQPIRRKIASNKEGREQQLVWKEFEKSITLQLYMNSFTDNIFFKIHSKHVKTLFKYFKRVLKTLQLFLNISLINLGYSSHLMCVGKSMYE